MCGIAALLTQGTAKPLGDSIGAMTKLVQYRGPDDEGYCLFSGRELTPHPYGGADTAPEVNGARGYSSINGLADPQKVAFLALGHRRLSIVDLSAAGHQPMSSADLRYWVVYNGEIYNHQELRQELEAKGYRFHSRSDTEVILHAYAEWGNDCVQRFNGMFAFLVMDRVRRRLFVARDRFGVKPLYYWIAPDGLIAFASEIKQLEVLPGWRAHVNGQRAYDFLNWSLFDHTDETLFEGVFQLRGGEALDLDLSPEARRATPGGRLWVCRWYELRGKPFRGTLVEAGQELRRLLSDSVHLRLRADVAVGSCLSGGLDSSAIVCLLNEFLRQRDAHAFQKTFSACVTVKRFDEREFIDEVVRHTSTHAYYVCPTLDDLFPLLDRIIRHQDEPFSSTSIYAQWHVFKLAAEHRVKVMLDGQGADEQLAGYHSYFSPHFGSLLRKWRWLTLWQEMQATKGLHKYSLVWGVQQALDNVLPEPLRQPLRRWAGKAGHMTPWLDTEKLAAVPRDPFLDAGGAKAPSVQAMSRSQLTATSLPMLLHWEDRDSMAHSVEARVPFLDYRLVEFVLGLPDDYKIAGGETKRALREGMRGVLPERIRTRMDKLGFVTSEEMWLREQDPKSFRNALRDAVAVSAGIIREGVLPMLDDMILGTRPFTFLPWRLISFGAWIRVFSLRV
jgi:asparagine synthase (glutamine-hydrolysing)